MYLCLASAVHYLRYYLLHMILHQAIRYNGPNCRVFLWMVCQNCACALRARERNAPLRPQSPSLSNSYHCRTAHSRLDLLYNPNDVMIAVYEVIVTIYHSHVSSYIMFFSIYRLYHKSLAIFLSAYCRLHP